MNPSEGEIEVSHSSGNEALNTFDKFEKGFEVPKPLVCRSEHLTAISSYCEKCHRYCCEECLIEHSDHSQYVKELGTKMRENLIRYHALWENVKFFKRTHTPMNKVHSSNKGKLETAYKEFMRGLESNGEWKSRFGEDIFGVCHRSTEVITTRERIEKQLREVVTKIDKALDSAQKCHFNVPQSLVHLRELPEGGEFISRVNEIYEEEKTSRLNVGLNSNWGKEFENMLSSKKRERVEESEGGETSGRYPNFMKFRSTKNIRKPDQIKLKSGATNKHIPIEDEELLGDEVDVDDVDIEEFKEGDLGVDRQETIMSLDDAGGVDWEERKNNYVKEALELEDGVKAFRLVDGKLILSNQRQGFHGVLANGEKEVTDYFINMLRRDYYN